MLQLQLQLGDLVQNLLRLAEKIFTHKMKVLLRAGGGEDGSALPAEYSNKVGQLDKNH